MAQMADSHTGKYPVTMLLSVFRGKQIFSSNVTFSDISVVLKTISLSM